MNIVKQMKMELKQFYAVTGVSDFEQAYEQIGNKIIIFQINGDRRLKCKRYIAR